MAEQMIQDKASEMAAKQTIPAGYKQTEVGLIPDDWHIYSLHELANFGGGTTPPRAQYEKYYQCGVHPWVKTLDLNNSVISITDECVTDIALQETSLKLHDIGSVLVAMYGGFNQIGRTGLLNANAAINQALVAIIPKKGALDSEYLLHNLNFNVDYWKGIASSSRKDPNITSNDVKEFKLPVPTVEEQKAIATAVSDSDALIVSLEQLIAKKQAIKTATMQQLLTGRTRLPPFSKRSDGTPKGYKQSELGQIPEDWETSLLGGVADKIMVGIASAATHAYCKSGIPMLRNQNIKPNRLDSNDLLFINKEYEVAFKNKRLKAGDLLTARTGYPGTTCIIPDDFENAQSFTTLITRPTNKVNSKFLSIFMNSEIGVDFFDKNQIGGGQKNINASTLRTFIVAAPKLEEQTAIATIISDMDMEIVALEEKLAKTRDLKQGMMQQLLTGRIRLPLPKEV
jgi:type I restriction enzyme S subunit